MKILHTSDWHVGKTIRGESRLDEHTAVLAEIAEVARRRPRTSSSSPATCTSRPRPRPRPSRSCCAALLDLHDGAPVVVIAGNHDNPARFEAIRPLAESWGSRCSVTSRGPTPAASSTITRRAASGRGSRCCRSARSGTRCAPPS